MINDLNNLDKDALLKLFERAHHIKKLLGVQEEISNKLVQISKILDPMPIYMTMNSHISILYRSLFQPSEWMSGMRFDGIDPQALIGTIFTTWEETHKKQIEYVNKVLAHQDSTTDKRGVYSEQITGENDVLWHGAPNSLDGNMREIMDIIMSNVNAVFKNKHGRDINLISVH